MIDPIREFWRWWADCDRPDAASVAGHVRAMNAGLGWEFSGFTATAGSRGVTRPPPRAPRNSLTVHSNGDPTLRALAARWAAAAVPTAGWEFLAARPANPSPLAGVVAVEGVRVDLSQLRFDATPSRHRPEIDVTGVHPAFDALPPEAARRVTELALADVLGETRLDLWIGEIAGRGEAGRERAGPGRDGTRVGLLPDERAAAAGAAGGAASGLAVARVGLVPGEPGAETPADGTAAGAAATPRNRIRVTVGTPTVRTTADARHLSGKALLRFVDDFAALERWRTWSRIGDAAVRWPLRGARWPRFDTHLAVARASPDLARALGEDGGAGADCTVVAWEGGGRIAHVYADGATGAPALVEASAGWGAVIERGYDPTLREVRHLAGLDGCVEVGEARRR